MDQPRKKAKSVVGPEAQRVASAETLRIYLHTIGIEPGKLAMDARFLQPSALHLDHPTTVLLEQQQWINT